jgi:hypothetical protein
LPFKANAARRHHIPKQKHRVTNWAEYDAGLRARGSLTVWFSPAISRWKRVIGDGPRSQTDGRQATEVAITADVLNRMLDLGRPNYVRIA